jgi:predicted dehydrogenase
MKPLTVAIIGCGRIGSLLEEDPLRGKPCTHAGAFDALSQTKIVAGCDTNPDRLKRFGERWEVNELFSDYKEMISKVKPDIVSIATWTHLHSEMVKVSARLGAKGIFCEKPIAIDTVQGKVMVRACDNKNIPLVINHERRWDPYYRQAKKLIEKGKIGELRTIIGNSLSWIPPKLLASEHGGGPLFHDGTHLTDLMLFFAGPPDWVSGFEIRSNGKKYIEETAAATIRFKNGAIGFIEGGGARKYFNFELDIQGSEGRILIGNSGRELYVTKKSGRFTGFQELEKVPFPEIKNYESPFTGGARDLVQRLKKQTPSSSSGLDGLRALQVITSIYKSAQNKGQRIKIR